VEEGRAPRLRAEKHHVQDAIEALEDGRHSHDSSGLARFRGSAWVCGSRSSSALMDLAENSYSVSSRSSPTYDTIFWYVLVG
jgi:hypothetical protein